MDYPRVPLTGSRDLFRKLAQLGGDLTATHLLESPKLDKQIPELIAGRYPKVEMVSWSDDTVWIDKAQITGFRGVREAVWNFHIGGYQVCEKWLKDRKWSHPVEARHRSLPEDRRRAFRDHAADEPVSITSSSDTEAGRPRSKFSTPAARDSSKRF
jgi:hypothetical protein